MRGFAIKVELPAFRFEMDTRVYTFAYISVYSSLVKSTYPTEIVSYSLIRSSAQVDRPT